MLVVGSRVLIREEGIYLPVQQLAIGDFIFDPFADSYIEIVDILSRNIDLPATKSGNRHPLRPVVIGVGHFGANRPRVNVAVSPFQELLVCTKPPDRAVKAVIDLQTADRVTKTSKTPKRFTKNHANYFAVFTEKRQYMDVCGLLMPSYVAELVDQVRHRPERSAECTHKIDAGPDYKNIVETSGKHHN